MQFLLCMKKNKNLTKVLIKLFIFFYDVNKLLLCYFFRLLHRILYNYGGEQQFIK